MQAAPKFLYFDLGNVLAYFSMERMFWQMGTVAGVAPQRVEEVLFGQQRQYEYETGRLSTQQFYDIFCEATGTRADYDALIEAVRSRRNRSHS